MAHHCRQRLERVFLGRLLAGKGFGGGNRLSRLPFSRHRRLGLGRRGEQHLLVGEHLSLGRLQIGAFLRERTLLGLGRDIGWSNVVCRDRICRIGRLGLERGDLVERLQLGFHLAFEQQIVDRVGGQRCGPVP